MFDAEEQDMVYEWTNTQAQKFESSKVQKFVNLDLKLFCNCLKANKVSLNASKTDLIVFRDSRK